MSGPDSIATGLGAAGFEAGRTVGQVEGLEEAAVLVATLLADRHTLISDIPSRLRVRARLRPKATAADPLVAAAPALADALEAILDDGLNTIMPEHRYAARAALAKAGRITDPPKGDRP